MSLRTVRGLGSYYAAATVARFGDEMVAFTLVLLVLERTGRPGLAGITAAAYALPAVLTGPLLGAWLDRTAHRRSALALNQAVTGLVMLGTLAAVGNLPGWIAPLLAGAAGITLPLVSGGFTSMLPALVPAPLLARANAAEAASFGAAAIAGPAAAATVAAVVSVEAAAITVAVSAAASVLLIARLPVIPPAGGGARAPFLASVSGGLVYLLRTPPLRASTVASTLAMGVSGILLIALPLHAAELGAPPAAGGYLWTAMEAGSVITAVLTGRLLGRWRPERIVVISVAAFGLAMLTWPSAPNLAVLLVLAGLAGLLDGATIPAMLTARQVYSPPELQGRVSTTAASLRLGAMALGQAGGGLLVTAVGTYAALFTVAGGLLTAAALGWLSGRSVGAGVLPAAAGAHRSSSRRPT